MNEREANVLCALGSEGPCTTAELRDVAHRYDLSPSKVPSILTALRRAGLVSVVGSRPADSDTGRGRPQDVLGVSLAGGEAIDEWLDALDARAGAAHNERIRASVARVYAEDNVDGEDDEKM